MEPRLGIFGIWGPIPCPPSDDERECVCLLRAMDFLEHIVLRAWQTSINDRSAHYFPVRALLRFGTMPKDLNTYWNEPDEFTQEEVLDSTTIPNDFPAARSKQKKWVWMDPHGRTVASKRVCLLRLLYVL